MRIYALPGRVIDRPEAEWIAERLLEDRGSYWVPVSLRLAPDRTWLDVQYGDGKSVGVVRFADECLGGYAALWARWYDEGSPLDMIYTGSPNDAWPYRPCRYAFDEVLVACPSEVPLPGRGWERHSPGVRRLAVSGGYRAGNGRADMDLGAFTPLTEDAWDSGRTAPGEARLATPTTPCADDDALGEVTPSVLAPLLEAPDGRPPLPGAERVDLRFRGRLVHRARPLYDPAWDEVRWQHRSADDWDNCADEEFLAFHAAHTARTRDG